MSGANAGQGCATSEDHIAFFDEDASTTYKWAKACVADLVLEKRAPWEGECRQVGRDRLCCSWDLGCMPQGRRPNGLPRPLMPAEEASLPYLRRIQ